MRAATAPTPVTDSQRQILQVLAKSHTAPQREVARAKALLLAADGVANTAIAARVGVSPTSVAAWRWRISRAGLDRTRAGEVMNEDRGGTKAYGCKGRCTSAEFARLTVEAGVVVGQCAPGLRHDEFLRYLRRIDRAIPKRFQIHLILDNYATHTHEDVQRWLANHERFHMHFTPTSSSWLNLVERWFRELTDKAIRRGVFRSVPELIAAIEDYLQTHNQDPQPFVWTASADSILEKVRRGRVTLEAISN